MYLGDLTMTMIIVSDENLERIWKYRVNNRLKTHNKVIERLLDNEEQRNQAESK